MLVLSILVLFTSVLSTVVLLYQIIFYLNSSLSFFVTDSMSDENFSNNLNVRIEIIIQCVLSNQDVQSQQQNSDSSAVIINLLVFKIKEISYFHPDLNKSYDEKDIVFSEKNTLIQNIHLFCNQIQNVAEFQDDSLVKINLPSCLHEIALQ